MGANSTTKKPDVLNLKKEACKAGGNVWTGTKEKPHVYNGISWLMFALVCMFVLVCFEILFKFFVIVWNSLCVFLFVGGGC